MSMLWKFIVHKMMGTKVDVPPSPASSPTLKFETDAPTATTDTPWPMSPKKHIDHSQSRLGRTPVSSH